MAYRCGQWAAAVAVVSGLSAGAFAQGMLVDRADTWPQWRGPSRDGQVPGVTWPDRLNDRITQSWRVDSLGPSYGGPIVSPELIFTIETRKEEREVVQAYARDTGELVWETQWVGAMDVPFFARKNGSWIRSTPAFDGERLYVGGMRDVLVCLDADSGEIVWRLDFVTEFSAPNPEFGQVCSPLVVGDHLYLQAGTSFCKLDKHTGEVIWRSLEDSGGMMGSVFSSPILSEVAGREQLVVLTRETLNGVAPEDGAVLWSRQIKSFRGMNILTPIVAERGVFTAPYGGRAQLLDVTMSGDAPRVAQRWDNRIQGYMTSPIVIDGHAYLFTRSNRFACVRLADGKTAWISPPTGDNYWSLVAQGDRILALNDTGRLRLIEATPEVYKVLDEIEVADAQTWAHLAIAGPQVVIREQNALVVYDWE